MSTKLKIEKLKNQLSLFITKSFLLLLSLGCCISMSAQGWEQLNDPPFIDHHTNSFGFEGKGYAFKGLPNNDGGNEVNQVWMYTPETDSWEYLTNFPGEARRISIGDDWEGKYYYGFGLGGPTGRLNDLWVFDPADMSFTQLPSCPCTGRSHPSLIAHNDKVYMGGGSTGNGDLRDFWEYDMITQVWTQKENIPGGVRHHTFHFSHDKYVYVGGGHVANWNRYDTETEEWTPIDNLPEGRVAGTQFNYGGLGFLLAGDDLNHVHVPDFETFMYYDPSISEWDYLPSLPNGSRWAPSSFLIGADLYFFAGLSDIIAGDPTMWKFDLSNLGCMPPGELNAVDVDDVSAGLLWTGNDNSISDTLKWRLVGEAVWNEVVDAQALYQLDNLESCQEYEFQIVKVCESQVSRSEIFRFTTDGCCVNPDIEINSIAATSATVEWTDVLAAEEYNIRWRIEDTEDWSTAVVSNGPYELTGLDECSRYEFQIETICSDMDIEYSESASFLTSNCGACLDAVYCSVDQTFSSEFIYINKIAINGYENISGNNGGYADFDGARAEDIFIGETFTFTFEPGFSQSPLPFDVVGWIDFNGDANFDENERAIFLNSVNTEMTAEILIPETALPGLTRLRVYFSNETSPCPNGSSIFGEAEDYCLNLIENPTSTNEEDVIGQELSISPNPFQNKFVLNQKTNTSITHNSIKILDVSGKIVHRINKHAVGDVIELPNEISAGIYFLIVENELETSKLKIVKYN